MRILAVGAHPDDLEILCAGTLARCIQRGDPVFMAVSTDGAGGSTTLPEHEISRIRVSRASDQRALRRGVPSFRDVSGRVSKYAALKAR